MPPQIHPPWQGRAGADRPPTDLVLPRRREEDLARRLAHVAKVTRRETAQRPLQLAQLILTLTRRQLFLLDLIAGHPLIATEDVAVLLGIATPHSLQVNHLGALRQGGLVTVLPVPVARLGELRGPAAEPLVSGLMLTPLGWQLLEQLYGVRQAQLTSAADAASLMERVVTHGAHAVGVYRFFVWLTWPRSSRRPRCIACCGGRPAKRVSDGWGWHVGARRR